MDTVYTLKDIKVRQDSGFTLLIDELELESGKIYALVGPNGSGKSTLLSTLALLNLPSRGRMFLNGKAVLKDKTLLRSYRRQITLVEQFPYLFDRSVYENVAYGLKIRGTNREEIGVRVTDILKRVGLAGFESRHARHLSVGEVQRVALARALVLQPLILLLDEPTSNIDAENLQVFEQLVTTVSAQGVIVVFSTHNTLPPKRLGAKLIRFMEGRIQHSAKPVAENTVTRSSEQIYE